MLALLTPEFDGEGPGPGSAPKSVGPKVGCWLGEPWEFGVGTGSPAVAGPVMVRLSGVRWATRRFEICTRENRRMLQDTATALLAVCGLVKAYDSRVIVDGLDLKVEAGSAVALMGPNGCGNSSVLRCLSGH